jgi:hypothetical protein
MPADSMSEFLHKVLALNGLKSHLRLISQLEKDLLSMIEHWEAAEGKTITDPELLALKKLCKDKYLFQHLGYGPLIKQENSISKWLTKAKEEQVFTKRVKKISADFKGKEKLGAMFSVIIYKADVVHGLILKVIQLLDKIAKDEKKSKDIFNRKFNYINKEIEKIFKNDPVVKILFEKLTASENLKDDITSLMLKTSDKSSSEMFWVNDCATCGYKFDPNK